MPSPTRSKAKRLAAFEYTPLLSLPLAGRLVLLPMLVTEVVMAWITRRRRSFAIPASSGLLKPVMQLSIASAKAVVIISRL